MRSSAHFIEYGLVALLFYRVWKTIGDASILLLPLLCALVVGTFDEWLQWFIPVRVGEARDVVLNVIAIGCGLLFAMALDPPPAFSARLRAGSLARVCFTTAGALLVFAAFFSAVHLGHVVQADGIGQFKSHYTAGDLDALSIDRVARWRTNPPVVLRRLSREDQYMDEGLWHVRRRNEGWAAEDFARAWGENLILENLCAGARHCPMPRRTATDGRQNIGRMREARGGRSAAPFVSAAEPQFDRDGPKMLFWLVVASAAAALAA